MTDTKKKIIFNALCALCMLFVCFAIFGFKISSVYTFNLVFGVIASVFFLIFAAAAFTFYKKEKCKDISLRPNIVLLVVVFGVCCSFCDWATTFTFDKWENKECLRQFMVDDFYDKMAYNIDNSELSKCTREQAKELLNTGSQKDRVPEITFTFSEANSKRRSVDIYYGFKTIFGTEYWLVLIYSGEEGAPKENFGGIRFHKPGNHYENCRC